MRGVWIVVLLLSTAAANAAPCDGLPVAQVERVLGGPTKVTYDKAQKTCVFRTAKPGKALVSLMRETGPAAVLDTLDNDAKAFLQKRGERKNKRLKKKNKPLLPTPLIVPVEMAIGANTARGFFAQANQSLQLRYAGARWVVRVTASPKGNQDAAEAIAKAWLASK